MITTLPRASESSSGIRARQAQTSWFAETNWSVVLAAGNSPTESARDALTELCGIYWKPLYVYARRRGYTTEEAEDLTQDFFGRLLEKNTLVSATPERGKFRSFLLVSFKHFLANERERARAQKRGGGAKMFSLDTDEIMETQIVQNPHGLTADLIFDQRWALTMFDRALTALREDAAGSGNMRLLERFIGMLDGGDVSESNRYAQIASDLDMTEGAVKMGMHRLRKHFRQKICAEVAKTVSEPAQIDNEVRYLFSVLPT